jgi:hypothetical protein
MAENFRAELPHRKVVAPAPKHRVEVLHHHTNGSAHLISSCRCLDLASDQGHIAIGWPLLEEVTIRRLPGPHLAMRETEENETVLTPGKASDPGLVRAQTQSQRGQNPLDSPTGLLDSTLTGTHDDKVIAIPHQHPQAGELRDPPLIQHVERDVRQQRGNRSGSRGAFLRPGPVPCQN